MNMAPSKERSEKAEVKDPDVKEVADCVSNKNPSESEIESEDRPLHIDTSSETKAETRESSGKVEEQVNGKKRPTDSNDSYNPTPAKKMRSKPKPQIIGNMKEYIDNNTIEKLTTTTLLHWLKERNLHCSTRDKKAELIQKVKNHFVAIKS